MLVVRSVVKSVIVFGCGVAFTVVLLFAVLHYPFEAQRNYERNTVGSPFEGISLSVPPAYAVEATETTPPLNTSRIGLIAYCQRVGGWTLADTVPAFVSYFDGGNYYDGFVRVWDSGTIGASSSVSYDSYVDVNVRVRADGWILAWFDRYLDDAGAIVWWKHTRGQTGSPPAFSTTLSRALEIVFTVAGVGFPGYDMINMYDYSEPNATRLLIFGHSIYSTEVNYYYTIPANSTMIPIKMLIRAGGDSTSRLYVDGGLVYEKTGLWGWSTFQIDAWTKGIQHGIRQLGSVDHSVAFIMWTG